jgi:PAS domain S-box-containing protein
VTDEELRLQAIISAQEKVIQQSQEKERRLQMIANSLPAAIAYLDKNLVFTYVNQAYCDWHGKEIAEVVGKHARDVAGLVSFDVVAPRMLEALAGNTVSFESRLVYGRLGELDVQMDYIPDVNENGKTVGFFSQALDVTFRKSAEVRLEESEVRFRDFAESSTDWLWETDENLCVIYVSERFQEVTGIDPSSYLGKSRRDFSLEDTNDPKWLSHRDVLDKRLPFRNFSQNVTTPDGRRLTVSSSARPVFNENGDFLGYRGTATDITEQQLAKETLDAALKDAEKANLAKSAFLATMSHEFRTPLNAILGFSDLLRAQYQGPLGNENYLGYASDIHRSGEHMLTLIDDVLDVAAIEAGKRTFVPEACNLQVMFDEAINNVKISALKNSIGLVVQLAEGLPVLLADKRSLRQILLNLLSNAIKFTPPQGKISLSAHEANHAIHICVSDTGIGIPAGDLVDIAKPFSKLQNDPHLSQEGTGLGLSIVDSLVVAQGGTLTIESEVDVGTSVTVRFPAQ